MKDTKIGKILNLLLTEHNLRVSELARRVQLPQPTVQRIVAGTCEHPHITSLKPIADYFAISVEQLKGLEPIPRFEKIRKLPLISWQEAAHWKKRPITANDDLVIVDIKLSEEAYALKVTDSAMAPTFPRESILIVEPDVKFKDRSYIITLVQGNTVPIFRQLIFNGAERYLKPLSPESDIYRMQKLNDTDSILGTVIQARWNYTD